ncbi:hypothetical protein AAH979_40560 [Plantactinospora sp. ZYX-F-223]|uniref:hypothetical protein n=1 Tax=Plantactinospora sp. ZYX-F-223 TaxID=3144103 RepID=UPI0031FBB6B8
MIDAYSPVPELNRLREFEERLGGEFISDGFELVEFGEPRHDGWSDAPEFVDGFLPFAYANSSGSLYAFWRIDDRADLATLPIVVFGDEGGIHLTALNLRDLLRQLACDRPLGVDWGGAAFGEYEGHHREAGGQGHETYLAWLEQDFGLTRPDDPNDLVQAATEELGERFTSWVSRYVDI